MTRRDVVRLAPHRFAGPRTVEAVLEWVDQILADQRRVFETNLRLAIAVGEIVNPDEDEIAAVLAEQDTRAAEARIEFRRHLLNWVMDAPHRPTIH